MSVVLLVFRVPHIEVNGKCHGLSSWVSAQESPASRCEHRPQKRANVFFSKNIGGPRKWYLENTELSARGRKDMLSCR